MCIQLKPKTKFPFQPHSTKANNNPQTQPCSVYQSQPNFSTRAIYHPVTWNDAPFRGPPMNKHRMLHRWLKLHACPAAKSTHRIIVYTTILTRKMSNETRRFLGDVVILFKNYFVTFYFRFIIMLRTTLQI